MAANPNSNIHNDTWMTDVYRRGGPLGENLTTSSYAYQSSLCGSINFDSQGRIVTVCPSIPFAPQVRIIDPETLEPIDTYDMPQAPNPPGTKQYQNFAGGGYFFLDQKDRIWVSTKTNHIYRMSEGGGRQHADARARLRPDRRARHRDGADQLRAARLQRPALVRLEGERQGRHARHEDGQDPS